MASKRSRPYDDPPSPESSEEEEEEEEEQQTPVRQPPKLQQQASVEEEEEEEDPEEVEEEEEEEEEVEEEEVEVEEEEEEEEEEEVEANLKTPPPSVKGPAEPEKKTAEPESDSDSPPSPNAAAFVAKPIVKESPVSKSKSAAKAVALKEKEKEKPAKAVAKPQSKQQGGEIDGAEKKAPGSGFSRVWSLEDEIAVLQAMIDYKKGNNKDPGSNHDEFYSYVIGKLSNGKLNKSQVYDKTRRLRSKYKKNVGKDGQISNPHERKMFQLSSKIWGESGSNSGNGGNSGDGKVCVAIAALPVQSYGNAANGGGQEKGGSGRSAKKMRTLEKGGREEGDMMEVDVGRKGVAVKGFAELYPNLMKAFGGESGPRASLSGDCKSYLSMVDSSKLEEWDRRWKEVDVAEMDAFLRRSALVQEVGKELLNTMKSN